MARVRLNAQDILSKIGSPGKVALARRITCINRDGREDPDEGITHIGGEGWRLSQQEAIRRINAGFESFYVEKPPGNHAVIVAGIDSYGNPCLRTTADGDVPNNLLSLPECR